MQLSPRRAVFAFLVFSALPALVACPKKNPPVVDAAPPPPPEPDTGPLILTTMEEDAGDAGDGDADTGVKKWTGTPTNTNVARLKQCCAQLSTQAKAMGASPEAGMFLQAAAQCNTIAASLGPGVNAPETGAIKAALAGRTVPPICRGF